jgi:hypothetical protein
MKTKLKIKSVEECTDINSSPVLGKFIYINRKSQFTLFYIIAAHFQHGILQPGSETEFSCIRATNTASKSNFLMAANKNNLYKGCIGEATDNDLLNTFMAIRSKTTNKVRLIQVQECTMISKDYDPIEKADLPNISKDVYFKKFAGKKGSSYFDKIEKQKMNVDVIKEDIEKSLINIDEKKLFIKELDLLKANHEADLLPPINNDQGSVDEIYDLKEIVTVEIFNHLEAVAQALLLANIEELPVKCEYVLKRIKNIQLSKEPDSPANINKLKICVYLDALSNLMEFGRRKKIDSNEELSGLSSPVEEHIRNNFNPAKSSL